MILFGSALIILSVVFMFFIILREKDNQPVQNTRDRQYVVPVAVNYAAPDLSLKNINERIESLSDFKGQVVLVNNWATWCPPCKAEMPILVKFFNDHHNDGLAIVAIEAGEPREQVLQYVKNFEMPFTVWLDPNGKALTAFANQNLPSSYVLDRLGNVRYAWTGEISREMLDKYIVPLLSE
jgi:cytochrome c biogenesis protein CcmG/thiol:disulfide interchange protein DsbE